MAYVYDQDWCGSDRGRAGDGCGCECCCSCNRGCDNNRDDWDDDWWWDRFQPHEGPYRRDVFYRGPCPPGPDCKRWGGDWDNGCRRRCGCCCRDKDDNQDCRMGPAQCVDQDCVGRCVYDCDRDCTGYCRRQCGNDRECRAICEADCHDECVAACEDREANPRMPRRCDRFPERCERRCSCDRT